MHTYATIIKSWIAFQQSNMAGESLIFPEASIGKSSTDPAFQHLKQRGECDANNSEYSKDTIQRDWSTGLIRFFSYWRRMGTGHCPVGFECTICPTRNAPMAIPSSCTKSRLLFWLQPEILYVPK